MSDTESEIDFNNMSIAEIKEKYNEMKDKVDKIDRLKYYKGLNSVIEMNDDDCSKFHRYFEHYWEDNTEDEYSKIELINSQDHFLVKLIGENVIMDRNFKSLFPSNFNIDLKDIDENEMERLKDVINLHFCPETREIRKVNELKMEEEDGRIKLEKYNDMKQHLINIRQLNKVRQFEREQHKKEAEFEKNENDTLRKYLKSLPKLKKKEYAKIRKIEDDKLQNSIYERRRDNRLMLENMCKEFGVSYIDFLLL